MFLGDNGEGKTNILEGISYLCISKSFYAENDAVVMKVGEPGFIATGNMLSAAGVEYEIRVEYDREQNQKSITLNKTRITKVSSLIGQFPIVILSPEQSTVTFGSPSDRRRFVDFVVSQSSRTYLESLIDYRKILKQRNRILSEMQSSRRNDQYVIEPWNENLVNTGVAVIKKRKEFLGDFQKMMVDAYTLLAGSNEKPGIEYAPSFECSENDTKTMSSMFTQALHDRFSDEQRVGHSLVGPHRDEFVFTINDLDAKSYASQGQHKTFLVALKLAEFFYLKDRCRETPILLFDDVLSELDNQRSQRLIEATADLGQIFMTSTDERALNWGSVASAHPKKFFVKKGRIERVEDAAYVH
jgi:DNA replication and repair protein RecF